ncbi:hypothetical protein QOT17_25622 [Balamuthia mandrillaris]
MLAGRHGLPTHQRITDASRSKVLLCIRTCFMAGAEFTCAKIFNCLTFVVVFFNFFLKPNRQKRFDGGGVCVSTIFVTTRRESRNRVFPHVPTKPNMSVVLVFIHALLLIVVAAMS